MRNQAIRKPSRWEYNYTVKKRGLEEIYCNSRALYGSFQKLGAQSQIVEAVASREENRGLGQKQHINDERAIDRDT